MTAKTAYVTGGASGIGRAVVELLARRGYRVAIADANLAGAQSVAASIDGALAVEIDAAEWTSQLAAFKHVLQEFGRIDYVLAIAGIGERRWIPNDTASTDFAKPDLLPLDIDLSGVLYTVALAVQQMRRQEPDERGYKGKGRSDGLVCCVNADKGIVVVAASVCGFYCVPTLPVYTAAKHGVVGFVRSYGKHLPTDAITLNAVCPNVVRTNISTEAFYSDMQARDLLVPMETVVEAFERCLDADISGETLEIEPHSGITHRSAPEPFDKDATDTLALLHIRASPLHAPEKVSG